MNFQQLQRSTNQQNDSASYFFKGKGKKKKSNKQEKNKSVIKELISQKLTFRLQFRKNKNQVVVEIWILIELL